MKEQREDRLKSEQAAEGERTHVKSVAQSVKSTKPLTRPTFELPGEAVARKLKEQREQRLKQQDAEAMVEDKKAFRARPVRTSQAPVIKQTAASKARLSLAKPEPAEKERTQNSAPTIRPASKRPASIAPSDASKRLSSLTVAKRTSLSAANTSARLTRGPSLSARNPSRLSIASTTNQRVTSDGKSAHQTVRGREVFERNKSAKEEQERIKKEKEDAAKKARADAAERGRIASRQWAEKQKARKASAEKAAGQKVAATES